MVRLVILIHKSGGPAGRRLEKTVREKFSNIDLEFYDDTGSFSRKLCQPNHDQINEIYLVLADTRERLEKMMGLKKLFDGRRLVLILSGNKRELLSMGHRLMPRYLSTETDKFEELVSVLKKMIGVLNKNQGGGHAE